MFPEASLRLLFLAGAAALALLCGTAQAALNPEWVSYLPIGPSLSASHAGMVVDAAGVSYVTGTGGSSSNTDVVTAAFGLDGSLLWSRTYNGTENWHDQGRDVALGPGGVLYVAGNTPGPGSYANVLLLAYDTTTGGLLNTIQYSSGPGTSEYGGSVVTDTQGNVYVGGGTVGDSLDGMLLKFNAAGQFQWKRVWDGPAAAPYSQDSIQQLKMSPDDVPVALIYGVMASLHPDYVVVKYAPGDGSTLWQATWGVSGQDSPRDMEIDASGDIYVTGTGINLTNQYSTIKLRGTDGQLLWQFYDHAAFRDGAAAIALDDHGGVYITGSVDPDGDQSNQNDNIYTVKRAASTGAFQWSHLYGSNCIGCLDLAADVLADPTGNVFVAGSTNSPPYGADVITLVLDSATGVETERGIVSGGTLETAAPRFLRFDMAFNLLVGGQNYHVNNGENRIALFRYASLAGPLPVVAAGMSCTPASGTLPFVTQMEVTLANLSAEYRTLAGRIDVTLAGGSTFSNWRSGYTNVPPLGSTTSGWNQAIPASGSLVGPNTFHLLATDVTPSPFNQPPYLPSGDTESSVCTVTGIAP